MIFSPAHAMSTSPFFITERSEKLQNTQDYHQLISQLCHELAELRYPGQGEALAASALEREGLEPTFVGRGLAVPHARVEGLYEAAVYIARGEGIDWGGNKADTVVLLVVPADQPELYLTMLSEVIRWRMHGKSTLIPG